MMNANPETEPRTVWNDVQGPRQIGRCETRRCSDVGILIDTEQRIARARGYFNEIATNVNTRLEIISEKFVACLAAMKPQPLTAASDFERAAVKVML